MMCSCHYGKDCTPEEHTIHYNLDASGEWELIREDFSELARLELGQSVNWWLWLENTIGPDAGPDLVYQWESDAYYFNLWWGKAS